MEFSFGEQLLQLPGVVIDSSMLAYTSFWDCYSKLNNILLENFDRPTFMKVQTSVKATQNMNKTNF